MLIFWGVFLWIVYDTWIESQQSENAHLEREKDLETINLWVPCWFFGGCRLFIIVSWTEGRVINLSSFKCLGQTQHVSSMIPHGSFH